MTTRGVKAPTVSTQGQVRIIGGLWRGRRLNFSAGPGLRPTPDRVRETLFNWLQPYIEGSRCLDLFTGSGALALEALSRGAGRVTALDCSAVALRELRGNAERLGTTAVELVQTDAIDWIRRAIDARFGIVFVDPPFHSDLATSCLQLLATSTLLSPEALVYLELPADTPLSELPQGWTIHREKRAGGIAFRLLMTS